MTANGRCFVEWKEEYVSQERGNRVVHYFLKDSDGESILAVVGTERSVRHMFYVVSDDFVRVYGTENSIFAGYKWRSRREVVDWLTSMLSKQQHLQGDQSKSPKLDSSQAPGSPEYLMNGFRALKLKAIGEQRRLSKNFTGRSPNIVWSGVAWTCGKQLKHYPAFCRNQVNIAIQSFVFVMANGKNRYLAYVEDMYEDKRGQKKVKVRWFHHNQEVKGVISQCNPHPKEVFITPHAQVVSAECVDWPATVLTREHFEKCYAEICDPLLWTVHFCTRQFRNNRLKPFDLRKLHGYYDQPILSLLTGEEDDLTPVSTKLGAKRTRRYRGTRKFLPYELPYRNLNHGLLRDKLSILKQVERFPWFSLMYEVDEKIELLSLDSGIRGCWFRCVVLKVSKKQMKVRYDDLQDEDDDSNLEEWVPLQIVAPVDKLGMRSSGRPTIRPSPPNDQKDVSFSVGTAVDAWWSDGWWEGVVIGFDSSKADNVHVFFPGESIFLSVLKKDLRISRDWVGDRWVDVEAKPDIISVITAVLDPENNVSLSSTVAKDVKSDGTDVFNIKKCISTTLNTNEDGKPNVTNSAGSDGPAEEIDLVNEKKTSSLDAQGSEENDNKVGNNDDGSSGKLDAGAFGISEHDCKTSEPIEVTA